MSEAPPEPPRPDDSPSRGDVMALGIGCLVAILLIGSALFYGFTTSN